MHPLPVGISEGIFHMQDTKTRLTSLEVALNNEARERDFYLRHAERTRHPLGKSMFETIAADESEHYQRILELHQKLQEAGKWPEDLPLKVKETDVKSILEKVVAAVGTGPRADADDLEAVKIAIDFEARGEQFYQGLHDSVEDPKEKAFFGMLAAFEREHRLSLEDTLLYFNDPEGWFQMKEGPRLDGG
jgi:rubrerythrin